MKQYNEYSMCKLCPRKCNCDRNNGEKGICGEISEMRVGRISLHMWEEPCISGENGSGTVFFAGCSLGCIYCQNYKLSKGIKGQEIAVEELAEAFISLQNMGAHNINLVTAEHFAPSVKDALISAREKGLIIPVVLNSSGYVAVETIELLKDVVDIYLVDFKYMSQEIAYKFSMAKNYPDVAKAALRKMTELKKEQVFDEKGMLCSGVIVRHLCLPGCAKDSKSVLKYLHETYGESIKLSIMSQYTPMENCKNHPLLSRKLSKREYDDIIQFCLSMGIEDAYVQEEDSASESFIPEFN